MQGSEVISRASVLRVSFECQWAENAAILARLTGTGDAIFARINHSGSVTVILIDAYHADTLEMSSSVSIFATTPITGSCRSPDR